MRPASVSPTASAGAVEAAYTASGRLRPKRTTLRRASSMEMEDPARVSVPERTALPPLTVMGWPPRV